MISHSFCLTNQSDSWDLAKSIGRECLDISPEYTFQQTGK